MQFGKWNHFTRDGQLQRIEVYVEGKLSSQEVFIELDDEFEE